MANVEQTDVAGYRLAERIGSGGMGDVYKAYNSSLNRTAAVKILYQEAHAERFKNEAYIQSSITHPNIARLYEYTVCANKHCIVMEYVEGECLNALLARKKKLSSQETEDILKQIVSALAYLHKKDIIHRDIKPQNFKVQADGTVKMLDFGIAKHKYSPKFTQSGFIVGTTEYLAPEQFQQQPELKSDVWALGVMTYELLTGYMPFEAPNPVMLQSKIRKGTFTDPKILIPQISEKLSTIIDRGLKVNPNNRISAAEIQNILGKGTGSEPSFLHLFKDPSKRTMAIAGMSIAVIILILFIKFQNNEPGYTAPIIQNDISEQHTEAGEITKENNIIINTPGILNSELISENGTRNLLPYTVKGKEGDKFQFTIRAAGYKDKEVQVVLTPRRLSYEFNLEKNN
ncbi:MAG: serine/threonine-protein kinase [Ferruginibacter sp.]